MRAIKLCLVALAAVFALSAVAAAGASATEILFNQGSGTTFEGESNTTSKLVAKAGNIECKKLKVEKGAFTDQHLGTATLLFLECVESAFKGECETSGNSLKGHITVPVEYHLGLADPGNLPAILILLTKEVIIHCAVIGEVKVKGSVIGLLETGKKAVKVGEPLSSAELNFTQSGAKPKLVEFLLSLASGAKDKALLLSSVLGGEFEESAEEAEGILNKFSTTTVELIEG